MDRRSVRGASGGALALLLAAIGAAAAAEVERGRSLAVGLCGRCHAVAARDASPLPEAPPFRTLGDRYPIESLAEALAEGLVAGHPAMPEVQLEPEAIDDLLAYLGSLGAGGTR